MNNADLIVATLKAAGIDRGFGIPSGNVLPLMEAMRSGGIDFVLTAHEGSAGFAADVTGRMTGKPGLCIATLGPGATNLTTGVGNAWLDRSPLIAITCNLNTDQLGRRIQMWIDHHALFAPITKASFRLEKGKIAETVKEAIRIAMSEPRGPVHLDLPEDVALAPVKNDAAPMKALSKLLAPPADAIAKAGELIAKAKRPIAVIGSSAMRMANPDLLRRVIERHNLPFATTTMAKGMIDEDHPLSVGVIERSCRQIQRKLLRSADLIVGFGYDTVEVEYEAWIAETPLLQIDIEKADVAPSVKLLHEVTGDLDVSLTRLAAFPASANSWTNDTLATHRKSFQAALRPPTNSFSAHAAIDAVRRALPPEGLLSFDVGAHTHQIASQWTAHAPKTFHITNGWSSMGFGLPGAIAAKLARPDLPVVCMLGDGCFQMTCGEVAVAKRMGITLPVVVLDDKWLALIKVKQIRRQFPLYGTALQSEDYTEPPAHYFGVPAVGVRTAAALETAVKTALAAKGPTVIEAVVDSDHYVDTVYDERFRRIMAAQPKGTTTMSKLRHIAVIVEDPEESAKFFEQAFDMHRAGTARRGIYMSDGIFNVALLKREGDEKNGLYHFGMWVDDLDESEKKVVDAGGKYLAGRPTSPNSFYEAKYKSPTGLVFDLTHKGWAGAVKDVVPVKEPAAAK